MNIINNSFNNELNDLCQEFLDPKNKKYVFGKNQYALSISKNIEVEGFVDDFTSDTSFDGKPIINTECLPLNTIVVSAVTLGRPLTVKQKLDAIGIRNLDYYSLCKYSNLNLDPVLFIDKFNEEFKKRKNKFLKIYDLLNDQVSKNTFENLINFRLNSDISFMEGYTDRQFEQYFEDFYDFDQNEVFVDVGGFDGITSLEFAKRCPTYKSIHIFEPDQVNLSKARENLKSKNNVKFYEMGLSNKKDILKFSSNGSSSKITNDGNISISVDKLDSLLNEPVTFIKMDIEGGEGNAIDGASTLILKHHPKLAICVYHKVDDFWKIPEQVFAIREDYDIYLRHYTEGFTETVMFFIPRK